MTLESVCSPEEQEQKNADAKGVSKHFNVISFSANLSSCIGIAFRRSGGGGGVGKGGWGEGARWSEGRTKWGRVVYNNNNNRIDQQINSAF